MGKFLTSLVLTVALLFLGATVFQYGINTFNPYFGFDFYLSFDKSFMLFLVFSFLSNLFTLNNNLLLSKRLDNLGSKHPQTIEEILQHNIVYAGLLLFVWLELWIFSLIIL